MEKSTAKKVTIRDIAGYCGVSAATASRVLSGSSYPVHAETRQKVLEASRLLGYIPNSLAQNLRTGAPDEIAVVIPTLSNPFYTSLVSGFEAVVSSNRNSLVLYVGSSYRDADTLIKNIAGRNPKGILIAAPTLYRSFLDASDAGVFPGAKLVFADCPAPVSRHCSVCFDYKKGTCLGTEYLIRSGHTNIVYAGLVPDRESRKLRVQGFREALLAQGLPFSDDMVVLPCDGTLNDERRLIDAGEHLAGLILQRPVRPTAIAAVNDMVAFGILRHLHRRGIAVPQEISVIGFDDTLFCEACNPPLTTVKVQDEQIGRMAGTLLLNALNQVAQGVTLSVEPSIVERASVAPPAEKQA
ncbi:MAG: LacI family DNA-binding transcriptional regulator [Hominenteromicrobium sp.]